MASPGYLATNAPEYDVNTYKHYQGCGNETELFRLAFCVLPWSLRKDVRSKS